MVNNCVSCGFRADQRRAGGRRSAPEEPAGTRAQHAAFTGSKQPKDRTP